MKNPWLQRKQKKDELEKKIEERYKQLLFEAVKQEIDRLVRQLSAQELYYDNQVS